MRLLVITPFLPYPEATSGAPRAIFDRLLMLSRDHHVTVASLMEPGERHQLADLRREGIEVHPVLRRPVAVSAADILRKRLRLTLGLVADSRPMLVQEFGSSRMRKLVRRLSLDQHFDLLIIEHILAAQYSKSVAEAVPTVLSEHDPRAAFPNKSEQPRGAPRITSQLLGALDGIKWHRYAKSAYLKADLVMLSTGEDAGLVRARVPGAVTEVVPFGMVLAGGGSQLGEATREVGTLLFVGNFDHLPNRDAALWLCGEIMPSVWLQRPHVKLWLVGKNPTAQIKALAADRVTVTGEVPSVLSYLQRCALFIAPLRLGGGMRIKLLEAMSAGTPVLTTPTGAQGLGGVDGIDLLVADSVEEIAETIVNALDDPLLRARIGEAGRQLVARKQGAAGRVAHLNAVLERVAAQKDRPK